MIRIILAGILLAATTLPALAVGDPASPVSQAAATGGAVPTRGKDATERVEGYITDLHRRLAIKPGQETQWAAFATAMRTNAARQEAEYKQRRGAGPLSAVEDLRAYAESERLRAADVDRLVPPFEALYGSMDAAQRANADRVFQEIQRRRGH